jgi:hypothetical protein
MRPPRLLLAAIGIGAIVALVAALTVNVLLPWSVEINVLDAPDEQVAGLNATELNDRLLSGELRLKSLRGTEKAIYLFTKAPMMLAHSWAYFFVSCSIAAFLGGLFVNRRAA